MQSRLKELLQAYLITYNPDLMHTLQSDFSVTRYLEDKISGVMPTVLRLLEQGEPGYVIEELAMNELTEDLRPSRFMYLKELLEREFTADYERFSKAGVLIYETINLVEACRETFDAFGFTGAQPDDRHLYYALIAKVHEYLN